jgi:hypothetical protein
MTKTGNNLKMNLPEVLKLATDVWLVPCKLTCDSFEPLLRPLLSEDDYISKNVRKTWKNEEDKVLMQIILERGAKHWSSVAKEHNLRFHSGKPIRKGKNCRERWFNHLNPDLQKGQWSAEEDELVLQKHMEIGNKWSEIAKLLPGRTENQVKNRFYSLKKKSEKEEESPKSLFKVPIPEFTLPAPAFYRLPSFLTTQVEKGFNEEESLEKKNENDGLSQNKLEMIALPIRISSLTSDPELQNLPQRVFSTSSEVETQSGSSFDINNIFISKKLDIDTLYNSKNVEKNEIDYSFGNFMKNSENLHWGFETDGFGMEKKFEMFGNFEFDGFGGFFPDLQVMKLISGQGFEPDALEMFREKK